MWRRLTNCECHNKKKKQLNGDRVCETLLIQYSDDHELWAYDKYQSQPPHTRIQHWSHVWPPLINQGGGYKNSCNFLRFIWNSTAVQRCLNNNRCFFPIPNTCPAPTCKTKASCVFFMDPSKTHLLQLNGTHMSSGIVHRWLQSWLCVMEWAWGERKWAECGGPLMRLKWNQIPIHASLEACVI